MEGKRPTRTQPALGKLELKKVAVSRSAAAAPAAAPSAAPLRRALVAEADERIRNAVVAHLPKDRFQVWAYGDGDSAYDHVQTHGSDVVILGREMPGLPGSVLSELFRNGRNGAALAIVLMSPRYADPHVGAGDCSAFGADEFVPLPSAPEVLLDRVEAALSRREPIERLKALPATVARQLDDMYAQLDKLSYYELLGVPFEADRAAIQAAFHQRSLVLHPDRHAKLRGTHPHAWEKVNTVYKRVSEAYKVLADAGQRHAYNAGLRRRSALRLEPEPMRRKEMREVEQARTPEARALLIQSLECRSLGDLDGAQDLVRRALAIEPDNAALADLHDAIGKLIFIVRLQST